MSFTAPIAQSALAVTVAVASLSLSLATDVALPALARTGLLLPVLLVVALRAKVLLLAVEIKMDRAGMVGMAIMVREATTTEVLEETVVDRTLAADLKEARATVAQEMVVIPAAEALGASLGATQLEDKVVLAKTVLVKEVTEPIVEAAARVVPTKEVRIRVKVKVTSPDALEQLARLPSAWVSRLRLEA